MALPTPLRPGDVVRIVAPCGAFDRERFLAGVDILKSTGLVPVFDDGIFAKHRYLAGDDARRLKELRAALHDDDARAVWIARGGYGATRLLPELSLADVSRNPKWLVGFSDATALHALWSHAGLGSCHGANVTTLPTWTPEARAELWSMLMGHPTITYTGQALAMGPVVSGEVLGGNLTVLAAMIGTPYMPSFAGRIVLLEDIGERPYRLDRRITQLVQAGVFKGAKGVVVGQLTNCDEPGEEGLSGITVVAELLGALGLPVLGGLALGHDPSSRSILMGAQATLDVERGQLLVER